jgi:hypothetical protein
LERLLKIFEGLPNLRIEVPREGRPVIVDKPHMASKPYGFTAFRNDRGRKRVFRFPRRLKDCFLQRHFNLH